MNADGSELCCDDIKEQQRQQREQDVLFSETSLEINRKDEQQQQASDGRGGGCPSPSVCVGGASVREDVVMEKMPTNFPEWSTGATTAAGPMMRRVSFPNDKNLVTGYMEPADPWANGELLAVSM